MCPHFVQFYKNQAKILQMQALRSCSGDVIWSQTGSSIMFPIHLEACPIQSKVQPSIINQV